MPMTMTMFKRISLHSRLLCLVAIQFTCVIGSAIYSGPSYAGMEEGGIAFKAGNYKLAMREILPLARQGDAKAQAVIALMYEEGLGVAKDFSQAAYWYEQSANRGRFESQHLLGMLHLNEATPDFQPDPQKAFFWIRKAAEQGNANSQLQLARLYQDGKGVARNPRLAVTWLRAAADLGQKEAQFQLGMTYQLGQGVERSDEQAFFWILVASAGGSQTATQALNTGAIAPELSEDARRSIRARVAAWQAQIQEQEKLRSLVIVSE